MIYIVHVYIDNWHWTNLIIPPAALNKILKYELQRSVNTTNTTTPKLLHDYMHEIYVEILCKILNVSNCDRDSSST